MIDQIISQLMVGMILGSIYSLMGIGLTLIWSIAGIPDYSQAGIYMLSSYAALFAASQLNAPFLLVILFAMVIGAVISTLLEKSVYRSIRIRPGPTWMRTTLICAVGLSYMIENIGLFLYTATPRNMPSPYPMPVQVGPISLSVQRLLTSVISVIFFAAIGIFIKWTWIGKAIRASAQNLEAAKLMGINVETIYSTVFALGGALSAAAACLVSPLYAIYPSMGNFPLAKCLVV
ncbi:MAG: branched-chain amino acid ABC transporter permease, partial [Candidatus Kryptoniota bacterium]